MTEDRVIEIGKEYDRVRIKKAQTFSELNKLIEWGVSERAVDRKQLEKELRKLQDEYDAVVKVLYDALMKLFSEKDKYKCPYCGGIIDVYSECRDSYDRYNHRYMEEFYGYGCKKCGHHDYPMDDEPINALLFWYKICQDESSKKYVLEKWKKEEESRRKRRRRK